MSRAAIIVTLIVTITCALVFAVAPELDLIAARALHDGGFWGSGVAARLLRNILFYVPTIVFATMGVLFLLDLAGLKPRLLPAPKGRSMAFLAISLALGPGLLVNVILKDHWHRPRPVQTIEFGGSQEFRPWYRLDGTCRTNCSFVSGETSGAAWLAAPAMLAPPPLRLQAMAAVGVVTVLTGLMRMAFGGHYLSDVLFAALFTLLLTEAVYRLVGARAKGWR